MPPAYFLDTAYIFALFNTRDQWHSAATAWRLLISSHSIKLLTTQLIMAEIADGLASVRLRQRSAEIIRTLEGDDLVEVVPMNDELFKRGMDLYETRVDKNWGLTDCTSFIVMEDKGLTKALTADDHSGKPVTKPCCSNHH